MPLFLILVGVGAGAASALLYASAASGSPLAIVLLYVAPLPVLLAGIGWRHHAGLIAATVGAVALTVAIGPKTGVYYVAVVGLPSWWLAYLALLARNNAVTGEAEWYPVGRLVVWSAAIGALLVAASIPFVATSLDEYRAALRSVFEQALRGGVGPDGKIGGLPGGEDADALIDLMARLAPGMAASFWALSSVVNMWLAGKVVRTSGRLVRPWPDLAAMTFPPQAALALAAAFVGSLLPGLPGLIAELFAGTFIIAFALLGLAVLHSITRRMPTRGLVLFGVYALVVLQPWVAVPLAALGLTEQLFGIRRRFGSPPSGPPPTAPANIP